MAIFQESKPQINHLNNAGMHNSEKEHSLIELRVHTDAITDVLCINA